MTKTTKPVRSDVPAALHAKLVRVAKREDRSLAYIIRKAITEYLERTGQ